MLAYPTPMDAVPSLFPPLVGRPSPAAAAEPLAVALIESRTRWRDFALLAADLVFETDGDGRITFLAPETVLGHAAEALIGQPSNQFLFADPGAASLLRRPLGRLQRTKAWLNNADGGRHCLEFTLQPHGDGLRGVGRDVTAAERQGEVAARALRRANLLGRLLRLGQRQGGAEASLAAMLAALPTALSCRGAAMLVQNGNGWQTGLSARECPPAALMTNEGLAAETPFHVAAHTDSGPCLLVWRAAQDLPLAEDERDLLATLALPMAALWAEMLRQRDLSAAADGDPLTGLLNRRGFITALRRRMAVGGALAFIDLDGLKPLNDRLGHEVGDAALRGMAARLRDVVQRSDLAARLGGDEFCIWLHGADRATAEVRLARIGAPGPLADWPDAGPTALRASLGIAVTREGESVDDLLARADAAMYAVKRAAGDRRR